MNAPAQKRERRTDPGERMLDDTWQGRVCDVQQQLERGRAFARGYWLGFGSATTCSLIWVMIDLWRTGRLSGWLGG